MEEPTLSIECRPARFGPHFFDFDSDASALCSADLVAMSFTSSEGCSQLLSKKKLSPVCRITLSCATCLATTPTIGIVAMATRCGGVRAWGHCSKRLASCHLLMCFHSRSRITDMLRGQQSWMYQHRRREYPLLFTTPSILVRLTSRCVAALCVLQRYRDNLKQHQKSAGRPAHASFVSTTFP